jgi:hypothetical protein
MTASQNGRTKAEWAATYCGLGWRLVLLFRQSKQPVGDDWPHRASSDPATVQEWLRRRPAYNLGVKLGPDSGVIDVEVDTPQAETEVVHLLGEGLAGSVPQYRGRRGLHRLFRWSDELPYQDKATFHWRGVEFRTGNGEKAAQSVLPPSVHPDDKPDDRLVYTWVVPPDGKPLVPLPAEAVAKIAAGEPSAARDEAPPPDGDGGEDIPQGRRHTTLLSLAGKLRTWGLAPEEIRAALAEVNARRCKPPLPERDLDTLAKSMGNYESGWGLSPPTFTRSRKAASSPEPTLPPPADFPSEALPGVLAEFVKQTAHAIGAPTPFVAMPVIGAAVASIGNTHRVRLKADWEEVLVAWLALLGESGDLKSPARKAALKFLLREEARLHRENQEAQRDYEWEHDIYKKARAEAVRDGGAPPPEPKRPRKVRAVVDDVTIEKLITVLGDNPRGLLLHRDELSGWVGGMTRYSGKDDSTGDMGRWLSIHDADQVVYDRKTGDHQTLVVPSAAVSVVGGIQPGVWRKVMTAVHYDSGLVARLLLGYVEADPKGWIDREPPEKCVQDYEGLLTDLRRLPLRVDQDGVPRPTVVRLGEEAHKAWVAFVDGWAERMAASDGVQRSMLSKLKGGCARLALMHHVVGCVAAGQDTAARVGKESVEAAVTLVKWFANQAERVYCVFGMDEASRLRDRLRDFVRRRGGSITPRNLHKSNRSRYPNAAVAEAALDALVKDGRGAWLVENTGGRPSKVFYLAPEPPPESGEEGG